MTLDELSIGGNSNQYALPRIMLLKGTHDGKH